MRSLVFAVTLLASIIANAAPALDFHTERAQLTPRQAGSVIIRNPSQESAFGVEVRFEYPEGLQLESPVQPEGAGWTCTQFTHFTRCRKDEFPGGAIDRITFSFVGIGSGTFPAYATLSARDLGIVRSLVFDVIASQSFVVTTAGDFGAGSLREAIDAVNANSFCGTLAPCTISFATHEPMTIAPASPLPAIRKCNVRVAGPDDDLPLDIPRPEKLLELSGVNAHFGNGLEVRASCAQGVPGVKISGLAVHSWPWNGIYFEAPAPHDAIHRVEQVYAGTDRTGLIAKPNRSRGINVDSPHDSVQVFRSIASANGRSGIAFWRGRHGSVSETKMGVDREGNPMGNGAGGFFSSGVPFELHNNTIAYNNFSGIAITPGTSLATMAFNLIHSNGNVPIDWGIDNRSRDDDDESDRIPNAPRVLDAFYDAGSNVTRVRGVVRLTAGAFEGPFDVQPYVAGSRRGDVIELVARTAFETQPLITPAAGTADVAFDVVLSGDYRGRLIALQLHAGRHGSTRVSSEISEALPAR